MKNWMMFVAMLLSSAWPAQGQSVQEIAARARAAFLSGNIQEATDLLEPALAKNPFARETEVLITLAAEIDVATQMLRPKEKGYWVQHFPFEVTWTTRDNGASVNNREAVDYCQSLTLGGYRDWRLPGIEELFRLYDHQTKGHCKVPSQIELSSCTLWSGKDDHLSYSQQAQAYTRAWLFDFASFEKRVAPVTARAARVLCVRQSIFEPTGGPWMRTDRLRAEIARIALELGRADIARGALLFDHASGEMLSKSLLKAAADFESGVIDDAKVTITEISAVANESFKKGDDYKDFVRLSSAIDAALEARARVWSAGFWVDPETGLVWTTQDNGKDVDWPAADEYCRRLATGGYSDWRLPTLAEIEGLYDSYGTFCRIPHKNEGFYTSFTWTSTPFKTERVTFQFNQGVTNQGYSRQYRCHCVRGNVSRPAGGVSERPKFEFTGTLRPRESEIAEIRTLEKHAVAAPLIVGREKGYWNDSPNDYWVDPETKLMWTVKGTGFGLRWTDASHDCQVLALGGYKGWRLPTIDELARVYDAGAKTLCKTRAPLAPARCDQWSGTSGGPSQAWYFNFQHVPLNRTLNQLTTAEMKVLCVRRSTGAIPASREYWVDGTTSLMWQVNNDMRYFSWAKAAKYCAALTLGGYQDWRVPDLEELRSIYDEHTKQNTMTRGPISLTTSCCFWSRTPYGQPLAWIFHFDSGTRSADEASRTTGALCVRPSE